MAEDTVLPKSIRSVHPEWFKQETQLGYLKGAQKQYRYGKIHIREYKDHVTVHKDRFDPRTEPLRHAIYEAPELLAGAVCGVVAGGYAYKRTRDLTGSAAASMIMGLAVGGAAFAAGWYVADKIREA